MNKLLLIVLAILTFLIFLTAMIPASLVHRTFQEDIQQAVPDLTIFAVDGSIWSGQGDIQILELPGLKATWDVAPAALLLATAETDLKVSGDGVTAALTLELTSQGGTLNDVSAVIKDDYINEISVPYGLDLSGEVQLNNANVSFNQNWLTALEGELQWTGGIVHIQTPEKIHTVDLPALQGELSMEDTKVKLNIQESGQDMIEILIKPDGWAEVSVNYAFMDLAGLPLPANARTDADPAIVLEEKIL